MKVIFEFAENQATFEIFSTSAFDFLVSLHLKKQPVVTVDSVITIPIPSAFVPTTSTNQKHTQSLMLTTRDEDLIITLGIMPSLDATCTVLGRCCEGESVIRNLKNTVLKRISALDIVDTINQNDSNESNEEELEDTGIETQDLDLDNPYVIGVKPPPDVEPKKRHFLDRGGYKQKPTILYNPIKVDAKGRKVKGRGQLKYQSFQHNKS